MQDTDNAMIDGLFGLSLEIEGLLALIMRREDCVAPEVYALLSEKADALRAGLDGLPRVATESSSGDKCESREAARERAFLESMPSLPGLTDVDVVDETPDAEMTLAINEAEAEEAEAGDACEAAAEAAVARDEAIAEAAVYEETEDAEVIPGLAAEPEEAFAVEPDTSVRPDSGTSSHPAADTRKRQPGELRRMFTINDKFRFRRELFGNSDTEFSDALNLVEAMTDASEAEEYFYTDLGWDRDEPVVVEFMAVVAKYFDR